MKEFRDKGYTIKKHIEKLGKGEEYNWVKAVKGKAEIDFFPVEIVKERATGRRRTKFSSPYVVKLLKKYYFYLDELLPLRVAKFGSGEILVPNDGKPYLTRGYGPDWSKVGYMTQDKDHYDLDEPIKVPVKKFVCQTVEIRDTKRRSEITVDFKLLKLTVAESFVCDTPRMSLPTGVNIFSACVNDVLNRFRHQNETTRPTLSVVFTRDASRGRGFEPASVFIFKNKTIINEHR